MYISDVSCIHGHNHQELSVRYIKDKRCIVCEFIQDRKAKHRLDIRKGKMRDMSAMKKYEQIEEERLLKAELEDELYN